MFWRRKEPRRIFPVIKNFICWHTLKKGSETFYILVPMKRGKPVYHEPVLRAMKDMPIKTKTKAISTSKTWIDIEAAYFRKIARRCDYLNDLLTSKRKKDKILNKVKERCPTFEFNEFSLQVKKMELKALKADDRKMQECKNFRRLFEERS